MGWAIACRLQEVGYALAVVDIREQACQQARAASMQVCANAAELACVADIVLVVVVNAQQIDTVLDGSGGLLHAPPPGQLPIAPAQPMPGRRTHTVLLCSTIAPQDTEGFARRLQSNGLACLDGPISGGPARARAGTMSMMLAGPGDTLARCDSLLRDMADKRFVLSDRPGDGARAKLVNNMLAGANLVAGAEALALAERIGLAPRQMYDIICASSGASWIFADRMARALVDDFAPRAAAHILAKDVGLAVAMADTVGHATPMAAAALARFAQTLQGGWAELDDGAVLKTWQPPAGS
jgi:3-hydroxyisobutyrate dehydrogenase